MSSLTEVLSPSLLPFTFKELMFGSLEFEDYLEFGAWNLGF
jgi:hypothetical protein